MLASRKMASLVQELKTRYSTRYVIFDLPPLLNAADALAFSPMADAVLLVVEDSKTRREDVARAAQLLGRQNLLGLVLNKARRETWRHD
jgi:Mrp family chromosome partitioning ATPase